MIMDDRRGNINAGLPKLYFDFFIGYKIKKSTGNHFDSDGRYFTRPRPGGFARHLPSASQIREIKARTHILVLQFGGSSMGISLELP
jgi:hypothetical protein